MSKAFAFDFDGLLVDALNECALVSWNGFHNKGVEHFGPEGLEAIPADFIERFKNHRNFASHLGHFLVPFHVHKKFENQADFEAAFSMFNEKEVVHFIKRVIAHRQAARQTHYKRWLEYHSFYPHVTELLKEISSPIYIVTAKDAASVDELLQYAGIPVLTSRIFGECRDKVKVLGNIAKMWNLDHSEVYFFDDNVSNACKAYQHGFNAHWATWGYNVPDHWKIAQTAGVPVLTLDDFLKMNLDAESHYDYS